MVLDEAHNIEDIAREAASFEVTREDMAEAGRTFVSLASVDDLASECPALVRRERTTYEVISLCLGTDRCLCTPPPPARNPTATLQRCIGPWVAWHSRS